jgi:YD repeat-containing protein
MALAVEPTWGQLSQNSGISSNDTWVTFNLTTQTQFAPSAIERPVMVHTHRVEIGYDANGQLVVNIWPTGDNGVPSEWGDVSVVRLAGGKITVFDGNGAPISVVPPLEGLPEFNPLSLLGSNPGASILSRLVIQNVETYAQQTDSQLSYDGAHAILSKTGPESGTTQWTYAPSGNVYVATQLTLQMNKPDLVATRTLQFTNLQWYQNAAKDAERANRGSTAIPPPPPSTSTPMAVAESPSSDCVPYLSNLGGTQNVAFVHGFMSDRCTWRRMVPWLNQDFRWGIELAPNLSSLDDLADQGNELISHISLIGGSNYLLIGHSAGGLVSRYAAQHFWNQGPFANPPVVRGVLTLNTPHRGAPFAAIGQGALNVLLEDMLGPWRAARCNLPFNNVLCYLIVFQIEGLYSPLSQILNIGALNDLIPTSSFLYQLNSQPEDFFRAAVIGNTPRRWIEIRVASNWFLGCCNPEDACGERNLVRIYGVIHNSIVASWLLAQFFCWFTPFQIACDIADHLLDIWTRMDLVDLEWNILAAWMAEHDGLVPVSSQHYPAADALQYVINRADSHGGATKSDKSHAALKQALESPPFRVPTQASCTFSVTPSVSSFSSTGGSGTFALATEPGCQ